MPNAGYGSLDPVSIPIARNSEAIGVFRLHVEDTLDETTWRLEPMPNVVPVTITIREGSHAPMATFRYVFDQDLNPPDVPARFHQVYGDTRKQPGVVQMDDRLVVVRSLDDGKFIYMFDGFVTSPQVGVGDRNERGSIVAHGTPHREWDYPLPGALWFREIAKQGDSKRLSYTDVPARFNILGKPNRCADGEQIVPDEEPNFEGKFYYFTDVPLNGFVSQRPNDKYVLWDTPPPAEEGEEDPGPGEEKEKDVEHWTVATAAQYVAVVGIEHPLGLNESGKMLRADYWVRERPNVSVYDVNAWPERLKSIAPKVEGKPIDMKKPETYEKNDIACPDLEVTGEVWPNALEKMIAPYGFRFRFDLRVEESSEWSKGMPEWYLTVYRTDYTTEQVQVYLQNPGDVYDPGRTNVAEVDLSRDSFHVGTEFEVDSGLVEYEATFILAPAFPLSASDPDVLEGWTGEHVEASKRHYYKRFVFGEGGEKFWDFVGKEMIQLSGGLDEKNLSTIFKLIYDEKDKVNREREWARKARSPLGHLFTQDAVGRPVFPRLDITTLAKFKESTQNSVPPAIWNGTGDWQRVTATHWRSLDDCIGVQILENDPNAWHIGKLPEGEEPVHDDYESGVVNLVEWLNDTDEARVPVLALTCVIQSDVGLDALAKQRKSSISRYAVRRRIDRHLDWKRRVVTKFSMAGQADPTLSLLFAGAKDFIDIRDDTDKAKDGAKGYQRAHEAGAHGGSITIKRITTAYNVGQVVTKIVGRNVDLQINAGAKEETPVYPRIQSITWQFDGEQSTTLHLTDERADPITRRQSLSLRPGRQR